MDEQENERKEDVRKFKNIVVEYRDKIAVITFNRPEKLNALNLETRREISTAIEEIEDGVRCLIFTGNGKAFAAGADINELAKRTPFGYLKVSRWTTWLNHRIENLEIPTIAAINGYALGAGCELAMSCDIRVASEKARFGLPELNLGIMPGAGGTQKLPRIVGIGMAKKLIFTGEIIGAEEALRIGLVEEIVEHERLMDRSFEIAEKISRKPPLAVKLVKRAINATRSMSLEEGLKYEIGLAALLFSTEDAKEGLKAFLEKREPEFKGR
jgi:enoyl-CoA hydratase